MKLEVEQRVSESPSGLLSERYDLGVFAAGWDSRCAWLVNAGPVRIGRSILITYPEATEESAQTRHLKLLGRYLPTVSDEVNYLSAGGKSLRDVLEGLVGIVSDLPTRRPLKVLVDLVGLSRYWSLGLLGWLLKSGRAVEVHFLYASASEYRATVTSENEQWVFRSGDWKPTPIPGLTATSATGARQMLTVSVGFEGRRTRRLIDLLEPDELLLVRSHGRSAMNNDARDNALLALVDTLPAGRVEELDVDILDVAASAKQISSALRRGVVLADGSEGRGRSALLVGPKTTSLALAICALEGDLSNLFYVSPDRYEEVAVLGVDRYAVVEVKLPWSRSFVGSDAG